MTAAAPNIDDVALLFEGGGMRASYTSAVCATLLREGLRFPYVAGISAGASNTANYLSQDPDRARRCFVEFAADPQLGDLGTFLRGQGMFNARYIYQETGGHDQALPFDWETFRANPAEMRIGAFHCRSGREVYWSSRDTPRMPELMLRVQASSSMPILMPPVEVDGELYLDGALGRSGGIPLEIAERDGYERFFVVLSRPRAYLKHPPRLPALYRRWFARYPAVVNGIRGRWHRYNETRRRLLELERQGRACLFFPETMPVSNGERDVAKLAAAHELGLAQSRRELPRWREFLRL